MQSTTTTRLGTGGCCIPGTLPGFPNPFSKNGYWTAHNTGYWEELVFRKSLVTDHNEPGKLRRPGFGKIVCKGPVFFKSGYLVGVFFGK